VRWERNGRLCAQHVCSGMNPFGVGLAPRRRLTEYVNTQAVQIYFPSQPMVKDITWGRSQDFRLAGPRVQRGQGQEALRRQSSTTAGRADGNRACQDLSGWSAACKGPPERPWPWKHDVARRRVRHFKLIQRDNVSVTTYRSQHDMVEATSCSSHQHGRRGAHLRLRRVARDEIYIAEATVPKRLCAATLFPDFVQWVDKDARASATRPCTTTSSTGCGSIPVRAQHRVGASNKPRSRPRIGPRHKRDGNHANKLRRGARIARTSRRPTPCSVCRAAPRLAQPPAHRP